MDTTFPFAVAYEFIAKKIMEEGLPKNMLLKPHATLVFVKDNEVYQTSQGPDISEMFQSSAGKAHLGQTIMHMVRMPLEMPGKDFCIVVVSEAYTQTIEKTTPINTLDDAIEARKTGPERLAGHPDSVEIVGITVHHRSGTKAGMLPILPGRKLEYQEMMDVQKTYGLITPSQEEMPKSH